jgi:outer membrane protein assembly factor BamB
MKHGALRVLTGVCLLGSTVFVVAGDWPQFRGPGANGVAEDKGLPVTWSADSNVVWKTEMPGGGTSSPIVVGNKVFLTCYSGYPTDPKDLKEPGDISKLKRHLVCVDRTGGKVLWTREFAAVQPEAKWQTFLELHGYASSTPVSDGKSLYVFLGITGVFAFDLDGKELWQVSVGKGTNGWGTGTSPVLYKDLLIVNASVESHALIALDRKTGNEVWQAKGIESSWSSPVLVKVPGATELVVSGTKKVLGFDPENGKELWHADSFNWYVCPTVVAHEGVVYALQNDTACAIRAGGRGDVTESHTVWHTKKLGSVVPSPVFHDGHIYWATDRAFCVKASDGTVVYQQALKPDPKRIYASALLAEGRIYYVSRTQGTFVVDASPTFKQLAHNTLGDDSVFNGSPAVSNGQLILRSDRYLYCIGKEK